MAAITQMLEMFLTDDNSHRKRRANAQFTEET